jgi:hypothetical protein
MHHRLSHETPPSRLCIEIYQSFHLPHLNHGEEAHIDAQYESW